MFLLYTLSRYNSLGSIPSEAGPPPSFRCCISSIGRRGGLLLDSFLSWWLRWRFGGAQAPPPRLTRLFLAIRLRGAIDWSKLPPRRHGEEGCMVVCLAPTINRHGSRETSSRPSTRLARGSTQTKGS